MRSLLPLIALACVPPEPIEVPDDPSTGPHPLSAVHQGLVEPGTIATFAPVRVVSGPTADERSVFVQDPVTGEGAEVRRGGRATDWPPEPGTPVRLRAFVQGPARAPTLWLLDGAAPAVLGPPEPVLIAHGAVRPLDVVRLEGVTFVTEPDPAGRARLSNGWPVDDRFGVSLPGLGNRGTLTGIVLRDGAITPRSDDDWEGTRAAGLVLWAEIADVVAGVYEPGLTVRVQGVQATPWTRDRRLVLLQGADGTGVWLDTEGWGHRRSEQGDLVAWTAQVTDADPPGLRTWWPREALGTDVVRLGAQVVHGAVVDVEVTGIGPVDALGERTTDQGWILDDRFYDLRNLPSAARIRAAVDESDGTVRLAVLRLLATRAP